MKILKYLLVLIISMNALLNGIHGKKEKIKRKKEDTNKEPSDDPLEEIDYEWEHFVGSNLFDDSRKICLSLDEVNLLMARRDFEMMIPRKLPQELPDEKSVTHILRYFYNGIWLLNRIEDGKMRNIMEKAYYDTLGGFLNYYLLPVVKYSYYACKVELRTVRNVIALFNDCRKFLNTNGNGWRPPMRDPTAVLTNVRIEPLPKMSLKEPLKHSCSNLDLSSTSKNMEIVDDSILVAMPKLDLEDSQGFLNNIWVPFQRKRTYNLRSCKSAFLLVSFYRSVTNCYEEKGVNRKVFDHRFRQWIVENIKIHLSDEIFYPGLGGVLSLYESLRGVGCKKVAKKDFLKNVIKNFEANSLIEEKSRKYANIIEGPSLRLRKRALNDEKSAYLKFVENNHPIDAVEKIINDWIEDFDNTALEEYCGGTRSKYFFKPKGRKKHDVKAPNLAVSKATAP